MFTLGEHISPFVEKGSGKNFYVGKLLCLHLEFNVNLKTVNMLKKPRVYEHFYPIVNCPPHHFVQNFSLTELSKLCGGKIVPETNRCLLQTPLLCLLIISLSVRSNINTNININTNMNTNEITRKMVPDRFSFGW